MLWLESESWQQRRSTPKTQKDAKNKMIYYYISQGARPYPDTVAQVKQIKEERDYKIEELDYDPPRPSWGWGIYTDDGTGKLKLYRQNWDSSG
jgi:hypothetical protein